MKRVMLLHLIPHEQIPKMFTYLEKEMEELFQQGNVLYRKKHEHGLVKKFFSYMRVNWIARTAWLPVWEATPSGLFITNRSEQVMTPKDGHKMKVEIHKIVELCRIVVGKLKI